MTIFITGATGFIGRHFLNHLLQTLKAGDVVYVLTRSPFSHFDPRVKTVSGDLTQIDLCENLLLKSDYVYHLAAYATFGNEGAYDEMNVHPTERLVRILSKSKALQNFIFVSTVGVLDRSPRDFCEKPLSPDSQTHPISNYGKSKLKGEALLRSQTAVPYTIVRPGWVYGKGMRANSHLYALARLAHQKKAVSYFDFPGKVPLIHVADLARALSACIDRKQVIGKTYIAVSENKSIGDIFKCFHQLFTGQKVSMIQIPRFAFILKRLHGVLPLTVSNLFLDYLCAEDRFFLNDFGLSSVKLLEEGAKDVAEDLAGQKGCWVITGAASGIGLALSRLVHGQGKQIVLVDQATDGLEKEFGASSLCRVIKADLSRMDELERVAQELSGQRINVLVNNAGVGFKGAFERLKPEQAEKMLNINFKAPVFLTKLLIHRLIHDGSTIVNVSSSIAFHPLPDMSVYAATKAALLNWSEALSYELKNTNCVLTLCPSGTKTAFQEKAGVKVLNDGKDLLNPEFVARKIAEAVDKKKNISILGCRMRFLLAVSHFLPRELNLKLWGRLFGSLR